jgi:hypothetical protein
LCREAGPARCGAFFRHGVPSCRSRWRKERTDPDSAVSQRAFTVFCRQHERCAAYGLERAIFLFLSSHAIGEKRQISFARPLRACRPRDFRSPKTCTGTSGRLCPGLPADRRDQGSREMSPFRGTQCRPEAVLPGKFFALGLQRDTRAKRSLKGAQHLHGCL